MILIDRTLAYKLSQAFICSNAYRKMDIGKPRKH